VGSWDTRESSGLLDDADVWVERAYFGYDAQYDDGNTCILILEGTSPDLPPEDNAVRQFFSTGTGWEPRDNGKSAVNADPKIDEFHSSCAYARFFRAVLELPGAGDVIKGRGFPDNAEIWNGLGFHLERMTVNYGPPIGERKVLLPTAYLGEGAPASGGGAAAKAKAAKAKAAANGGKQAEIVEFAKGFGTHDEFLTAAYGKWADIESFDEFADLIDENGAIWTAAQG
jgi:hypothetical protein